MAIKSISGNKGRAMLTMLGIIIGVSAVIILVSLGQGSTKAITDRIQSLGTNMLTVRINGRASNRSIEEDDLFKFAYENEDCILAVAPNMTDSVTVKYGNNNMSTSIIGTNESYRTVKNTNVQQGRFFNALDIERRQKVAVIGTYVVSELFSDVSPIGKQIKVNGELYTVIGILEEKSTSTVGTEDDVIITPYTAAKRLLRNGKIQSFYVQAKSEETVDQAMEKLEELLYNEFQNDDLYRIFNQAQMLDTIDETTQTMTMMLGGIAAISLLVGGIGIMNIMLVSVTERTREIGIRKSIGAKRKNILVQFLIESIVISCLGGVIGIIFGVGMSNIIGKMMRISAEPSAITILASFSFSAFVGIFFGFYPASRASKLSPIEALRHE